MSISENNDNPYAVPPSIESETMKIAEKAWKNWGCCNTTILVFAAPMFLFCVMLPVLCLMFPVLFGMGDVWQWIRSLLFVVGFIGMCYRKEWAYAIVVMIAVIWAMIAWEIADAIISNPDEEPPFPGAFIFVCLCSALNAIVVALMAFFLTLSGLISRYKNYKLQTLHSDNYD